MEEAAYLYDTLIAHDPKEWDAFNNPVSCFEVNGIRVIRSVHESTPIMCFQHELPDTHNKNRNIYNIVYLTLYFDDDCVLLVYDGFSQIKTFAYGKKPDEITLTKLKLMV